MNPRAIRYLAAATTLAAATLCACSSSNNQPSASSSPALTGQPTPGYTAHKAVGTPQPTRFIANNIDDAILLEESHFNRNGSILAVAHVDSATTLKRRWNRRAPFSRRYTQATGASPTLIVFGLS